PALRHAPARRPLAGRGAQPRGGGRDGGGSGGGPRPPGRAGGARRPARVSPPAGGARGHAAAPGAVARGAGGVPPGARRRAALVRRGGLRGHALRPAARADMLRRLGRWPEAREAYRQALGLVASAPERRFLERRLAAAEAAEAGALTSFPTAPHDPPAGRVRI